jgi:hypothetical protein
MKAVTCSGLAFACIAALSSCATEEISNAPPAVVDECRREAALLTEPAPWLVRNDPIGDGGSETDEVIEDARTAEAEADREGLAGWPEEVLVYRCLLGHGVALTREQADELAEWERRLERDSSE